MGPERAKPFIFINILESWALGDLLFGQVGSKATVGIIPLSLDEAGNARGGACMRGGLIHRDRSLV